MPRPCDPRDPCCLTGECEYAERLAETAAAGDDYTPAEHDAMADRAADRYQRALDRQWGDG